MDLKEAVLSECLDNSIYEDYLVKRFTIKNEKPDKSCFKSYQCQLLPIVKSESALKLYKCIENKGKPIKLKSFDEVVYNSINKIKEANSNLNKYLKKGLTKFVDSKLTKNGSIITLDSIKKRKEELAALLKKVKNSNFKKSKEYKKAKEDLEEYERRLKKKDLMTKWEFVKRFVPKVRANKWTFVYFCNSWKSLFGEDIRKNKKWLDKYNKFFEKSHAK